MDPDVGARPSSALPRPVEWLGPWAGAVVLIGTANTLVLLLGARPSAGQRGILLIGLIVVPAAWLLIVARARRAADLADLDEARRPSIHELRTLRGPGGHGSGPAIGSYVPVTEAWTAVVLELVDHAVHVPGADRAAVAELLAAAEATDELQGLLRSQMDAPVGVVGMARLHSVCTSWAADQPRVEAIASGLDPSWHRRWQARAIVERRAGASVRATTVPDLPYET